MRASGDPVDPDPGLPASSSTRQWLIQAAQREIAERGFGRVSMRNIAGRAQVDPSLVRYYFGSKQQLLLTAVQLSLDLDELTAEVLRGTPSGIGPRIVRLLLDLCDEPGAAAQTLVGFSASLSSPEALRLETATFLGPVLERVTEQVSPDHPQERRALVTVQLLGLVMGRYLLADPLLKEAGAAELSRIVGRAVQRDLTAPWPAQSLSYK